MVDYNSVKWEDYFYYDESSPSGLRWKIDVFAGKNQNVQIKAIGDIAGSLGKTAKGKPKSWDVRLNYKLYKAHRIIYTLLNGEIDNLLVIDHFDQNPTNNRIDNLRLVSQQDNMTNQAKKVNNTSGSTGVRWVYMNKGRHLYASAEIQFKGQKYAKLFPALDYENAFEEAIKWRKKKILELNQSGADFTEQHGN